MKRVNLLAILAISFSLTSFVACTLTPEQSVGTDEALSVTAQDEAQVATVNDEVISSADTYVSTIDAAGYAAVGAAADIVTPQKLGFKKIIDGVVTITVDRAGLNDFPKNICIDFGTAGVTVKRGNVLKGKIYITVTGRMTVAGSSRTFLFSDFYVNGNQLRGGKTVTFKGNNDAQKPYWTIVAKDTLVRTDSTKVIWNTERVRTFVEESLTGAKYYSITGTSNGINGKGVAYTMEITKPLIIGSGCPYFVSGSLIITTEKRTALLDYGDGTADAIATLTINGVTKEIKLKK
jgi:hypothetical protein